MKVFSAFPTPIYINNIEYDNDLLDTVKNYDYESFHSKELSGRYTVSKNILDKSELKFLRTIIEQNYNTLFYDILGFNKEIEFRIATSWVVKLEPQDFGHKHYHCNSFFSGVLYLEVDETTSPIVFYKNGSNINEMGDPVIIEIPFNEDFHYNEFNSPSWKYQPKKGDLILFPSNLAHMMPENSSNITRYSLAFNIFPYGILGKNTENALELK